MPESRVLKYNEQNLQRQKDVKRAHDAQQLSKGKKTTVLSKITLKNRDSAKDFDCESRSSTPTILSEKTSNKYPKCSEGSVTPTSNDSSSENPKKKRR